MGPLPEADLTSSLEQLGEAVKSGQISNAEAKLACLEYVKTLPPPPPAQDPSDPAVTCVGCDSRCYADLYFWMSTVGPDCFLFCPRCYQVMTEGLKRSKSHQHWRSGKRIPPEPSASPPVSESQAPSSSPS